MKRTYMPSREESLAARRWYLMDAQDQVVGRMATRIANILRGKNSACFVPHHDAGDFVVVVNIEGMRLTGSKLRDKLYYRHSGYPGGLRVRTAGREMAESPERLLRKAVEGMLPKNRLGRSLATKLKVYRGPDHPHVAQKPTLVDMPVR